MRLWHLAAAFGGLLLLAACGRKRGTYTTEHGLIVRCDEADWLAPEEAEEMTEVLLREFVRHGPPFTREGVLDCLVGVEVILRSTPTFECNWMVDCSHPTATAPVLDKNGSPTGLCMGVAQCEGYSRRSADVRSIELGDFGCSYRSAFMHELLHQIEGTYRLGNPMHEGWHWDMLRREQQSLIRAHCGPI